VQLTHLSGGLLGLEAPGHIWIDSSAAGWGWSVSGGQMDLQTVVTHAVGHVLGFADHNGGNDIMTTTLGPGIQRLPEGVSSNDDVLTDRSDAVEARAFNPAAVVAMMAFLAGATAVDVRGERSRAMEGRNRRAFQV
jgi:hypothetical protein